MNHIKKYFEHLLDPQLIIIVLVIIMGCVALKMFFASKVDGFKDKYKTKFYIYVSAAVFTYALVPLMGYSRLFIDDKLYEFIFYQIASLGLGILHCFLYRYYFKKFDSKEALTEYLFAILIVAFASIPFLLIYSFLNDVTFAYWMLMHFLWFFVPTLLNDSFNRAISIPPVEYESWQFPANYKDAGVKDEEMRDLVLISLVVKKEETDENFSSFRAKAPSRVEFGRLFYNFILDYNEKNPDEPIQIEDEKGLCNWIFYLQPKWYEKTRFIIPDKTFHANELGENSVIFCIRKKKTEKVEDEQEETDYIFNNDK